MCINTTLSKRVDTALNINNLEISKIDAKIIKNNKLNRLDNKSVDNQNQSKTNNLKKYPFL